MEHKLHLSWTSKLHCWSLGFPAWKTCPVKGKICKAGCYAKYGTSRFPCVDAKLQANFKMVKGKNALYLIKLLLNSIPENLEYFRFFWSGDCFNPQLMLAIFELAKLRPMTKFWVSTRTTDHFAYRPVENLIIRQSSYNLDEQDMFSIGDGYPHGAMTTVQTSDTQIADAWECPGECGTCRVCFEPCFRDVPVAYRFHGSAVAQLRMKKYLREGNV